MRSIRGKFLEMNLISIILCVVLIGGLSLWSISSIQASSSREILGLTCRVEGQALDDSIRSIQDSVELFCGMTDNLVPSLDRLEDQEFVDALFDETEKNMGRIAKITRGVCAYYFRTAPELTQKPEGFFYGKRPGSDRLEKEPLTDLSIYDPSDMEHVGWYYAPQIAGKAIWMEPYYNQNLDIYMVSYVVPFFRNGQFWAIAGMDIDFDVVIDHVKRVTAYDTGYDFLCGNEGKIYYHPTVERGASLVDCCPELQPVVDSFSRKAAVSVYPMFQYHFNGERKTLSFHPLNNGMKLLLTAENREIKAPMVALFGRMLLVTALLCAAGILAIVLIINRITRPLESLTLAAEKIAQGELDVDLPKPSGDEVGILTKSFQVTVASLKQYVASMNNMAFTDPLTQVKNKMAYDRAIFGLKNDMAAGNAKFGLVMLDLNGLKYINDHFGHERGDEYIVSCVKLICNAFKHSPVFRVGGDEFVVILLDDNLTDCENLVAKLNRWIEDSFSNKELWKRLSIAKGVAFCTAEDKTPEDVFSRADKAMYEDKQKMKQHFNQDGLGI